MIHTNFLATLSTRSAPWRTSSTSSEQSGTDTITDGKLTGRRILIVEDEAMIALNLQFAVEDEGAEVVGPALTLDRALATTREDAAIDAAILDVDVGGKDVFPVAEMLVRRSVPFVFHTGHGSRRALTSDYPRSLTCLKPASPAKLIDALVRLID